MSSSACCPVMLLLAMYLMFLPPLLSGRPRDRCWCPCDRLCRQQPSFLSEQPGKPPLLIIPILPIPFSHACIRFCYCYWLLLFWCIACFCNCYCYLPAYPKLLSIGWLVIHQWPPLVLVAPASSSVPRSTWSTTRAWHLTSRHAPLVARLCRATIECRGWSLITHFWW